MGKGKGDGEGVGKDVGKDNELEEVESRDGVEGGIRRGRGGGGGGAKRGWAEIDNDTARYIFLRDSTLDGSELLQKTSKRNDWGKERLGHKGSRRLGRRLAMISNIEE